MSVISVLSLSLALASCGADKAKDKEESKATTETSQEAKGDEKSETPKGDTVKITMVTDEGGVNDKSFNQSAFEGL